MRLHIARTGAVECIEEMGKDRSVEVVRVREMGPVRLSGGGLKRMVWNLELEMKWRGSALWTYFEFRDGVDEASWWV